MIDETYAHYVNLLSSQHNSLDYLTVNEHT